MREPHGPARELREVAVLVVFWLGAPIGHAQVAWDAGAPAAVDSSFSAFEQTAGSERGAAGPTEGPRVPDNPQLNEAFALNLGAMYVTNATTQASKTGNSGVGGVVDFENALGLKQETWVPFASARWRFAESWRVEAEYFSIKRSASKRIGENIDWDGSNIPAGAQVDSRFDFTDVRLSAGWSFYKTQDKELGVALGLHVEDIRLDVSSASNSNGAEDVVAPLPVFSIFGGFAMSDHWSVAVRFDTFDLSWDPYKGHLYDLGLDLVWNPWRNFGIGAGYRSLQLSGSVNASRYKGELDAAYSGPIVYLTFCF